MNKKRTIIAIFIIIIAIIFGLWISGIIPKQIAKISAMHYLEKNFPKKQYEYINAEWSSSMGGYAITVKDEKDKMSGFMINSKYLPISPGQGIYALDESYRIEYETGIEEINDFYNHSLTDDYKDIRSLPKNYSKEQAQKDKCFIVGAMVDNDNIYSEFMEKYNKKENAFIRVVQSTFEGDICIIDVLYEAINDKVHVVKDNTRDKFSSEEDRIIEYITYEKTGIWNYQNSQYWVVYNGELPDGTKAEYEIDSNELFIITTISSGNCIVNNEQNNKRSPENVTIEVLQDTITPSEVSILITDQNEVVYGWGVEFRVQEKINGEWKDLQYISDEVIWIAIAYIPNEDKQLKETLDIEKYYGKLSSGIYRIVKLVYDNGYIDLYSNEFEIK